MIDKKIVGQEPKTLLLSKRIWKVFNAIICIAILPILIVNLTMLAKTIATPGETPSFLGYKFFIVLTGSMEHTLDIGDFVIVKEVPTNMLKAGDIISFEKSDVTITHRIKELKDENGKISYITKGDNNNTEDGEPVKPEEVQGKFVFCIRGIGKFVAFLQTVPGIVLLIAIPLFFTIVSLKMDNYAAERKMIRKSKRIKYDGGKD